MKNVFKKNNNNTALFIGIGAAALLAGAVAYLYLTEEGEEAREKLTKAVKDQVRDITSQAFAIKTGLPKRPVRKVVDHVA